MGASRFFKLYKNRESIYGCGPAELEKPEYGRLTQNGRKLYVHIFENTLGPLPILGLQKEQVESLRLLDNGRSVPVSTSWVHSDYPEILFADLGTDPMLPDPVDTVLETALNRPSQAVPPLLAELPERKPGRRKPELRQ